MIRFSSKEVNWLIETVLKRAADTIICMPLDIRAYGFWYDISQDKFLRNQKQPGLISDLESCFQEKASEAQKERFKELQDELIKKYDHDLLRAHSYETGGRRYFINQGIDQVNERYGFRSVNGGTALYMKKREAFFQQPHPDRDKPGFLSEFGPVDGRDQKKIPAIEQAIHSINGDPFESFVKIAKKNGVFLRSVHSFVCHRPERWKDSCVAGLAAMPDLAEEALDKAWVETKEDVAASIKSDLRSYSIDTRANLDDILKFTIGHDAYNQILRRLAKKCADIKPRIEARPMDPEKVTVSNNIASGVSELFAQETQRRGRQTPEQGGRAGWGQRRPDLWKPEQK